MSTANAKILKATLDELLAQFDFAEHRANDPVELVWDYSHDADREVVALLSSSMAYGRVETLKQSIRHVLAEIGPHPSAFIREQPLEPLAARLDGFVYRMTRGPDVIDLLSGVRAALVEFDSLETLYAAQSGETHLERASGFVRYLRTNRRRDSFERGFRYLLPDPADGSSCKRLNLFFRWMGRGPDGVDLGLWSQLRPDELLMPLDTHTSRICRYIGLTDRKTVDGKMAREVTESLKAFDPDDPLRYDFALCHLGISQSCIHERSEDHCPTCPIEPICRL